MFSYNNKAFTLIELMVWIWVISILALSVQNIDFSRLSNEQRLEIYSGKIKNTYEGVRNNSLSWKWIWVNLNIPYKWSIDFSKNNNWTIMLRAFDENNSELPLSNNLLTSPTEHRITSIQCWELNESITNYDEMTSTWTIEFKWVSIKFNTNWDIACNQNRDKILKIEVENNSKSQTMIFNTLNWLVETK